MSMTDPIADLLTRIRNAAAAGHASCEFAHSRVKEAMAGILEREGYVAGCQVAGDGVKRRLAVKLKYDAAGAPVVRGLRRVSRPGCRVYRPAADLPRVLDGMGISIVSTSRGLLTDREARAAGVGGEILCEVW